MQKLLNKMIAVIITVMLASSNMIPAIVYAANIEQNAKTSEENVEFNATINGGYNATLNLDEGGKLDLNLKVSGTGYLKDAKVTLQNNNYQIDNVNAEGIKLIEGNTIELDEVNTGKILNVSLPIKLNKDERVASDILGRDSKVTLDAIYVNENGKERKINKTLTEHVEWTSELQELVSQSLVRYLTFDENKTMVSFKINEGIQNNKMPVGTKEITINVPTLEQNKPSNVIVTGEAISYTYENDVITIKKENAPDAEGKVKWDSQDEYMITYIYDAQVEEAKIESQVVAKAQVKGNTVEAKLVDYTYELKNKVGEYVEVEALGTDEINKGYMYTNLKNRENNLETTFEVRLKANVGFKDVVDIIRVQEQDAMFNSLNADNSIVNKKVKIDRDNLINILGENGTVKVLTQDGTELGTLSKDMLEIETNQANIALQTSKVENEGNLEIILQKAINSNFAYSKAQLKALTELTTNAVVEGYKNETLNSSKQISKTAQLQEPTSNAKLNVNMQNLSTVVKNEDVIITATLKTKDIRDALYTNARMNIVLPEQVKSIDIKEAGLIYEDELVLNNLVANNNVISLQLDGTQTRYSLQATSEGTVIRIVADVTLDNLAPTTDGVITLNYSNEETGEANQVATNIGIVAPTGFVTTNTLEVNGEKITAQESSEKISKVDVNSVAKEMQISGTVVNNLGHEATGVTILGTIPTSGNKDANDIDLGSNFDTTLSSVVNVNGLDAKVLYSENANEDVNGSNWTENPTDTAKAYKIVANGTMDQVSSMTFNYNVRVPENLQYGNTSKSTYAVYYNNNAEQGQNQNVVLAKAVGISTGAVPQVILEPSIVETNTGAQVQNNGQVKEGKFITYSLNVRNTGSEVANNIQAKVTLPSGIAVVKDTYEMSDLPRRSYDYNTKTLTATIESLNAGETKTLDYNLVVVQTLSGAQNEQIQQTISAEITADKLQEAVKSASTINIVKGDLEGYAATNKNNKNLRPQSTVSYSLKIQNANYDEKNNVKATIKLPSELKVQSVSKNDGTEYNYDERTNTITYTRSSLKPGATDGVLINLTVADFNQDKQVKVTATVTCDGMQAEEIVNDISYNLTREIVIVSQTSNIPEGNLGDTDDLEYYINVTNNSNEKITVEVSDNIPSSLRVSRYEVQDANGTRQEEYKGRAMLVSLDINPSETARLTIMTKPYTLQKGRVANIENSATITLQDNVVQSNSLKHKIVGTSASSAGPSTSPDGEPGSGETGDGNLDDDVVTKEGTFKVRGTVWLDENSNGIKELSEQRVSGLTVRLFNKNTGNSAVDVDGKELVTTTNESGNYIFVNVLPDSYVVVIDIDGQNYGVAPYKAEGVSESENSDFVTTKLDGKKVAATDEIKVENANIYNIDLGLVKNRIFDLDISKTVTRISVANTKADTKTYNQDNLSVAKVELATANVDFATVLVEYRIAIQNNGQISGYAKSIIDYIPDGMTFNSELNSSWYLGQDGNAYNTSLANTLINPGETKVVTIVLSRKMSGDNMGTVRNTAKILMSYNEYGLEDIDSNSEGTGVGAGEQTDDKSSADVVIGTATGKEVASFTGITLGILAILGIAVYEIKKHIISKMYNFIERS